MKQQTEFAAPSAVGRTSSLARSPGDPAQKDERPSSNKPRVSIGMPMYNGERYIREAIESILKQTFTDLELIISDNASTDRSFEICREYANRDPRVVLLRNPVNLGANPNYRLVAKAARGEFFKWQSANDLLSTDYIERCVAALDRQPQAVLAYGRTVIFENDPKAGTEYDDRMELQDDNGFERYKRCIEGLRLNNVINGLIRSDVLGKTSLMPDYHSSDNVVLGELALAGKFALVADTHFYRRMDLESATRLQSTETVRLHHYPQNNFGSFFQNWKLSFGLLGAVIDSDLTFRRRMSAYGFVARHLYWQSPRLLGDFREAFVYYVLRRRE
jgi:glycosyltransferase involved in cell wall biosynthesis